MVLIAALAVVVALVLGELVARPLAEQAVGRDIQQHYDLDQRPDVQLNGFPFLLRVALGRLPSAEGRLSDSVIEGLRISEAELRYDDVRFDPSRLARSTGEVTAERGSARVTVTDADLTALLAERGVDGRVRFTPGTVEVTDRFTVRGISAEVTATGELSVVDDQLRFEPTRLSAGGVGLDPDLLEPVLEQLAFTVTLPRVAGVQPSGLVVEEGRVTLTADLTDPVLTG